MIWSFILSLATSFAKPLFDWLNTKVDADKQMHIVDTQTLGTIATAGLSGLQNADNLMAGLRAKEGNWGPTVVCMVVILAPFVWHEYQVVLDSSRFIPGVDWLGWIPYPTIVEHRIGSWGVPGIGRPGPDGLSVWDKTEQAIFTSFFIGATTALTAVAAIRAIKR